MDIKKLMDTLIIALVLKYHTQFSKKVNISTLYPNTFSVFTLKDNKKIKNKNSLEHWK